MLDIFWVGSRNINYEYITKYTDLFFLFDIHNAFSANVNILEIIIVAISMFDVMLFKRMLSLM